MDTELSTSFLELACDFEAQGYCVGSDCDFWFKALSDYQKYRQRSATESLHDEDLAVLVVNYYMSVALVAALPPQCVARILLEPKVTQLPFPWDPFKIVAAAQNATLVMAWHFDESRTRATNSELHWLSLNVFALALRVSVEVSAALLGCEPPIFHPEVHFPKQCATIQAITNAWTKLAPELERRSEKKVSQC